LAFHLWYIDLQLIWAMKAVSLIQRTSPVKPTSKQNLKITRNLEWEGSFSSRLKDSPNYFSLFILVNKYLRVCFIQLYQNFPHNKKIKVINHHKKMKSFPISVVSFLKMFSIALMACSSKNMEEN
jgi:hypothetical protein